MFGHFGVAQLDDGGLCAAEQLQEQWIGGPEYNIAFSILQLREVSIVDGDVRVEVAAVLERIEETDGGKHCLTGAVGIVTHDQQGAIEHSGLPNGPQLLVAGVKVLSQLHLLEATELQQYLLGHYLLEGGLLVLSRRVEILNLYQGGAVEVIDVVGDIDSDLVIQNWENVAGEGLWLWPFL